MKKEKIMTTPIQATNNAEKPSGLKRAAYALLPSITAGYEISKALSEGKTAKEALNQTKGTFKDVHNGNKEQFKENIHNMAEQSREMGNWKYLLGLMPVAIEKLDEAIN